MKCEQIDCTKKAKLKVSFSYGGVFHYCFKHAHLLVKSQLSRLAATEAGMFIQRVPIALPKRQIAPEAREHVTTPSDREASGERVAAAWEW